MKTEDLPLPDPPVYRPGDPDSLGQLLTELQAPVYRIAYRFTGHRETAEDATQEVLMRVVHGIGSFNGHSSVTTWAYRITANVCLSIRRKQVNEPPRTALEDLELTAPTHEPSEEAIAAEQAERLQVALAELSPKYRMAFLLRTAEHLSYAQIAEAMDMTVGNVRSTLCRARDTLATALGYFRGTSHEA